MSLVPEVCQKCGGELSANQKRTRFRCRHCGSKYRIPRAPLLAEPDTRDDSGVRRRGRRLGRRTKRREWSAEADRPARRQQQPGCLAIVLDLLVRMFFRLVVHLISTTILLTGIGLIVASVHYGDHGTWQQEYGIGAGVLLSVISLLFLTLAPGPRPRS